MFGIKKYHGFVKHDMRVFLLCNNSNFKVLSKRDRIEIIKEENLLFFELSLNESKMSYIGD